ncbi:MULTISPECIES: hypothetical protein [Gammaproteobacteria]|uniref:hypothetical protein n=1 Tax=Gammaproteobacteria TaxID=1236 RepID=UPI000D571F48|nr:MULTISPECIES: hypothetical protein [Gammaproteobacteria]EAB9607600.1 hypothetical protein [Salmonella enterica subsp. enterica serovar Infantis]ECU8224427.1 hypothetical protein [Salmonella enterica subsp. enterica serovar Thompson]EFB1674996.1 hypothetical protein [Escherichia coli]EFF6325428.1 hypothetical protein [Escherichia coli]EGK3609066.1 hypothetical protein [Escherichia coli]
MAVIDVSKVDTTPGNDAVCSFSPPEGWKGESAAYVELMRSRYRDLMHGQRMLVTASFARRGSIKATGPFADEAMQIINSMKIDKVK